jgi:hypothetical protein
MMVERIEEKVRKWRRRKAEEIECGYSLMVRWFSACSQIFCRWLSVIGRSWYL